MKTLLLYSGGKDSSLVAYLLEKLGYEVQLITANFGIVDSTITAQDAAKALGFQHEVVKLDPGIIEKAAKMCIENMRPREAITYVHKEVLEAICEKYGSTYKVIADGIRRDDRTPKVTFEEARSLEDRHNIEYFSPLIGIGYKTINYLSEQLFKLEVFKAGSQPTSEYETEIRATLRSLGVDPKEIFPEDHNHTLVKGWNSKI